MIYPKKFSKQVIHFSSAEEFRVYHSFLKISDDLDDHPKNKLSLYIIFPLPGAHLSSLFLVHFTKE